MFFDEFADEWYYTCGACRKQLFAPTRQDLFHTFTVHTRSNDCLGGW